jgi:hypothetical protein
MRRSLPLLLAAACPMLLAACAQKPPSAPALAAGCGAERAGFIAAIEALPPVDAPGGEAYLTLLRQTGANNDEIAAVLAQRIDGFGAGIDRVDRAYGALATCRGARAEAARAVLAASKDGAADATKSLADERQSFDAELAQARAAAARIAKGQAILAEAAERLVAAAPGGARRVIDAVATPTVPTTPYLATENAVIFGRPEVTGPRIADLRKGQRVQGPGITLPGSGAVGSWITLTLNDASLGYVDAAALYPVQTNPSSVHRLHPRAAAPDSVVDAALAARSALPAKAQGFESRLEAAAEAAVEMFSAAPAAAAETPRSS